MSEAVVSGVFTVLFAFSGPRATARSIFEEKKTGCFRRLMSAYPSATSPAGRERSLPNFAHRHARTSSSVIFAIGTLGCA